MAVNISPPMVIAAIAAVVLWSRGRTAGPAGGSDREIAEAVLSSGEDTDAFFDDVFGDQGVAEPGQKRCEEQKDEFRR